MRDEPMPVLIQSWRRYLFDLLMRMGMLDAAIDRKSI
jgi:hypothetical protein